MQINKINFSILIFVIFFSTNLIFATCRFCQNIFLVKIILVNGVHQKGFVEFHPENEFEDTKDRIMEVIKKKGFTRFYYLNDEIKDETLPHSLYNKAYYDIPYKSIFKIEILK